MWWERLVQLHVDSRIARWLLRGTPRQVNRKLRWFFALFGIALLGHCAEVFPVWSTEGVLCASAGIWVLGMVLFWGPRSPWSQWREFDRDGTR